eukprot:2751118-Pleurochrysis_carterae.AAC.2
MNHCCVSLAVSAGHICSNFAYDTDVKNGLYKIATYQSVFYGEMPGHDADAQKAPLDPCDTVAP